MTMQRGLRTIIGPATVLVSIAAACGEPTAPEITADGVWTWSVFRPVNAGMDTIYRASGTLSIEGGRLSRFTGEAAYSCGTCISKIERLDPEGSVELDGSQLVVVLTDYFVFRGNIGGASHESWRGSVEPNLERIPPLGVFATETFSAVR